MKIFTIGDSHANLPWWGIKSFNIITNHQGPMLCYSFAQRGLTKVPKGITENDWVVYCFGEIDCRAHVHKHITPINTYKDIIDNIVVGYFNKINEYKNIFKTPKIAVFNVAPPQKAAIVESNGRNWPCVGSDEERKLYHLYFNEKLNEFCQKNNFLFFNVYKHYLNSEGFLELSLADQIFYTHLQEPKFIEDFIRNNML